MFAFLSPLAIFADIPFAAALGGAGGPGPIDFGNGAVLTRLAELGAAPARVDLFALLGPILALPATIGWYVLLRAEGRLALLGVVMWYFGMVFIIAQDAVQLALVSTLPASYAAADTAARVAIEAVGTGLARSIEVLAFSGHLPNGFGIIQALADISAFNAPGTLTVIGGTDPQKVVSAGTYPIAVAAISMVARGSLYGANGTASISR